MKGCIMKIMLRFESFSGHKITSVEVDAQMPFDMHGLTFAVHRNVNHYGNINRYEDKRWVVSEITTGAAVHYGKTRGEAIANAHKILTDEGAEKTQKTVRKYRRSNKNKVKP